MRAEAYRSIRSDQKGFTLVEILVAILVFAIGAIAIAQTQTGNAKGTNFGREALVAATVGETQMETLKGRARTSAGFAGLVTAATGHQVVSVTSGDVPGLAQVSGMTMSWTARNVQGTSPNRYLTVEVTVRWNGNQQEQVLTTIVSQT
jgi:prepilin-type N-terminal cleavage/methylation domain-containing protein